MPVYSIQADGCSQALRRTEGYALSAWHGGCGYLRASSSALASGSCWMPTSGFPSCTSASRPLEPVLPIGGGRSCLLRPRSKRTDLSQSGR